jgi:hypothetical protein
MTSRRLIWVAAVCFGIAIANVTAVLSEEKPDNAAVTGQLDAVPAKRLEITIDVARDRAEVAQQIYAATLRMLHDRYFHRDKSVLPARAMQDIFDEMERSSNVEARWISASLKPMSIDHTPESDFEKRASKAIAGGAAEMEVVEDGYYRRAIAIPLTGGCLGCHEGVFQNGGRRKFAGLVISLPLAGKQ